MVDPLELSPNPDASVVSGEDLVELRLVLDAFGEGTHDDFDVQVFPAADPATDGAEYYIVTHQP